MDAFALGVDNPRDLSRSTQFDDQPWITGLTGVLKRQQGAATPGVISLGITVDGATTTTPFGWVPGRPAPQDRQAMAAASLMTAQLRRRDGSSRPEGSGWVFTADRRGDRPVPGPVDRLSGYRCCW